MNYRPLIYLVALQADIVPIQVDGPEPGVDLQSLGQQSGTHVPHAVPTDVQHLRRKKEM